MGSSIMPHRPTVINSEPLAFAIICNEETERAPGTSAVDAIAALVSTYPNFGPSAKK